jgi:hypothetical protein
LARLLRIEEFRDAVASVRQRFGGETRADEA